MRTGIYFVAIMAFMAGLVLAAGPVRAQNQDQAPNLYVTPGTPSTAHPLFLQRLFGGSGANGKAKPYDFSTRGAIRREAQDWREMFQKLNDENKAKFDEVIGERKKAIADMYAQSAVELRQDALKRRQAEAQSQAQANQAARQARVVRNPPVQHHTSRGNSPPRHANTAPPPVYYNNQQQNAHPPIFLH